MRKIHNANKEERGEGNSNILNNDSVRKRKSTESPIEKGWEMQRRAWVA